MSKLTGNRFTLALAMDAILPLTSGLVETIMASNQIPSSQVTTSTANTTSKGTE
jgi:hypothetical protein